ncbi:unnamed protein product [marine sediment metagenome]|uniref:Uncharacterized protein n=1 Tax=marine sediment metagenome TaxID=412755 RepID=X1JFS2_9ZZZZ
MIEKIDANQIGDILEKSSPKQPDSAKTPTNNGVDASLQVNYASLIEKAKQTLPTDSKAVQLAQELLLSGQLESPKNIRAAAKDIIKFGI